MNMKTTLNTTNAKPLRSGGLRRSISFIAVTALLAVAAGLAGILASAATTTVIVGQQNGGTATGVNEYNPAAVNIAVGDTVTWNSAGDAKSHDVTSFAEAVSGTPDWYSGILRSGTATSTFSKVFPTAGVVTYYCGLHAGRADADPAVIDASIASGKMVGKITVTGASPSPSVSPSPSPSPSVSPSPSPSARPDGCAAEAQAIAFQVKRVNSAFSGFHTDLEKLRKDHSKDAVEASDKELKEIRQSAVKAIHATRSCATHDDEDEDASDTTSASHDDEDEDEDEDRDDHKTTSGLTFSGTAASIADQAIAAMQVVFDSANN